MSVRTHAPECAKTKALRIQEDTGISATVHECTCGAEYEDGVVEADEHIAAVKAANELGSAVGRMYNSMFDALGVLTPAQPRTGLAVAILRAAIAREVGPL